MIQGSILMASIMERHGAGCAGSKLTHSRPRAKACAPAEWVTAHARCRGEPEHGGPEDHCKHSGLGTKDIWRFEQRNGIIWLTSFHKAKYKV